MSKLLRADFMCLWKNRYLWMCMAFVVVVTAVQAMIESAVVIPEYVMFEGATYLSITICIFIGMFIGTEYNEGTFRNKILTGHSRWSLYFTNLIVCVAAALIFYTLSLLTTAGVAIISQWKFGMQAGQLFPLILSGIGPVLVYTALFTVIDMLVGKRAESLAFSILLVFLLSGISTKIDTELLLYQDNFGPIFVNYLDEDGKVTTKMMDAEKKPDTKTKVKHEVYQFLNNVLPSCQFTQIANITSNAEMMQIQAKRGFDTSDYENQIENVKKIPLYAALFILVILAAGGFLFEIKNLK